MTTEMERGRGVTLETSAIMGADFDHELRAQARALANEMRSPLAVVRMGAELLTRADLSQLQSQRVARNVIAAAVRMEEILSDFALQPNPGDFNQPRDNPGGRS